MIRELRERIRALEKERIGLKERVMRLEMTVMVLVMLLPIFYAMGGGFSNGA